MNACNIYQSLQIFLIMTETPIHSNKVEKNPHMISSWARASAYDGDEDEGRRHLLQMGLKMNEVTSSNLNLRTTKVILPKGNEDPIQMNRSGLLSAKFISDRSL